MDGIITIYKERGYTSHDVVAKLRGILHQKKIGHTGTLDPEAEGVLPVCLGKGTKLCDMLSDRTKTYQVVLRLGVSTDTEDMTGTVLEERKVTVTEEEVISVIASFVGENEQIPPMYSAKKVNGKKLYELAREGKVIERKASKVQIYESIIDRIELPYVTMTVSCSKGTYIRSLCRDIGEKLGCLGAMQSLLRTRVGEYRIEDAIKLAEVEQLVAEEKLLSHIFPVDKAFSNCPKYVVPKELNKAVDNGNSFRYNEAMLDIANKAMSDGDLLLGHVLMPEDDIRIYKEDGMFVGLYSYDAEMGLMRPKKLFFVEGR